MNVFGDNPVLPKEATDLETHAEQCAIRYNNLARVIHKLQVTLWIYQALLFPALVYIIAKLNKWDV